MGTLFIFKIHTDFNLSDNHLGRPWPRGLMEAVTCTASVFFKTYEALSAPAV